MGDRRENPGSGGATSKDGQWSSQEAHAKRVTITVDAHLYRQIEAARAMRGMSRSGFFAEAARELVLSMTDEDRERTERLGTKLEAVADRLARSDRDTQIKVEEVYALIQAALSRAQEISRDSISQAAEAAYHDRRRYWRERRVEKNRRRGRGQA